jgi:NADH-quinone oxidoreductase subunit G/NADP-reducing hydrogenase subunit HndD
MNSAFNYWQNKLGLTDADTFQDVDYVLTTRELAKMFKKTGIDFEHLPSEEFDQPLGISTGAGVIFGATGGVMEAAVRTAYEVLTGKPLPSIDLNQVRGFEGIREAELEINGQKIKVAVAHTLKNARTLLEQIEEGKSPYAFIEVMTCPGGCLGGGGQPIPTTWEIRQKRAASIYEEDRHHEIRKSHENPAIKAIYEEFLHEPLGHVSHELLHTGYVERGVY